MRYGNGSCLIITDFRIDVLNQKSVNAVRKCIFAVHIFEILFRKIKQILTEEPEIRGVYDVFVNNYGPGRDYASLHVELPDTMDVEQVDILTRKVQKRVFVETGVILTGMGVYSYNTRSEEAGRIRNKVMELVLRHEWALQLHGFYVDIEKKEMRFDVVMSFDIDPKAGIEQICREVQKEFPDYKLRIVSDIDIA